MSNSVSRFIHTNNSLPYSQYFIIADNYENSAHISFDTLTLSTCVSVFADGEWLHVELTKDQITHFLSLDCPDAFIAYALTLCPCPPETSDTALSSTDDVDGGILFIAKRLKEIKEEINILNGSAFENATLTDAQHYQLLDVEMFIADFIAPYCSLPSETVVGTSEIPLPDCPVCHEPVDIDQFNHNGGACNFCYHELSNDSYLKAFDLERRLL
ncbi:MAG: hypothetical protein WBB40_03500 [Psychrobacter alimentarius]